MNKILIGFLLFFCFLLVYAFGTNQEQTDKALLFYQQENYDQAVKEYEIMILEGLNNPYVFYNLSNAYYKIGNIGKASVNIERALRLVPRDKDIQYNRMLLAKLAKEPDPNIAEFIVQEIKFLVSLNEITVIAGVSFAVLAFCFGLYCLKKQKIFFKSSIFFFILFVLSGVLMYIKFNNECIMQEAIVLTDTYVRNKPIKTEEVAFEVFAGRKVIILFELGKWVNIKLLLDGFSGWVDKNSVEKI
ncbi:MAG: hypothetical protein PHR82_01910 [Endomicrobiaceae bacterium]|nr:hypothetical protein [Endomicrobiaceae bacterium]